MLTQVRLAHFFDMGNEMRVFGIARALLGRVVNLQGRFRCLRLFPVDGRAEVDGEGLHFAFMTFLPERTGRAAARPAFTTSSRSAVCGGCDVFAGSAGWAAEGLRRRLYFGMRRMVSTCGSRFAWSC